MPDITKCTDSSCPDCKLCYRFTAPDDNPYYQSYFMESPRDKTGCEYFWKVKKTKPKSTKRKSKK